MLSEAPRGQLSLTRKGMTLLEVVLVIGIVAGIAGITLPAYRDYQIKSDLLNAVEQVRQAAGRARIRAQAGERGMPWGYAVAPSVIFAGESFDMRDARFDERHTLPVSVAVSGLAEVTFLPLTGTPSRTGAIILTSLKGEQRSVSITIDREGIAVDSEDRLTICHCAESQPHTLRIPEAAWPAHRKHGDYMGNCHVPDPQDDCKIKK